MWNENNNKQIFYYKLYICTYKIYKRNQHVIKRHMHNWCHLHVGAQSWNWIPLGNASHWIINLISCPMNFPFSKQCVTIQCDVFKIHQMCSNYAFSQGFWYLIIHFGIVKYNGTQTNNVVQLACLNHV